MKATTASVHVLSEWPMRSSTELKWLTCEQNWDDDELDILVSGTLCISREVRNIHGQSSVVADD